ncbi:patatin-related protein [Paracoccus halophilus]|uniref:Patatin n=1 Tax=Paracoccus halophilus TaxID=376733 RepID=A0A099F2D3_9RHOB|nr:patatin-like protein [Paracoccus halophilus]KGJ04347.1 patatin [Paracoccus halophilus]SFA55205.1 patatin-related protein [Paracoccus halophilus]
MVEEATGEVRFAVVLYGGVSLAIYMNGIAQELLSMVRGSSDLPDEELQSTEKIYRELSHELAGARGGRKRFVIDIISGTSAGGINGVALAKALAIGSRDMKVLREAWTDKAHIGRLLNDRAMQVSGLSRTESLLDGGHMYEVLFDTLSAITGDGRALTETLDLFVTATDLHGQSAPIHLTGAELKENIHKTVFHFAYDRARPGLNQFTAEYDGMLAFAARCTSSFPVAFPPMRFSDMPRARRKAEYSEFFGNGGSHEKRLFADGGYLDNRPFSHAIEMIPFRPTTLPGERKLIFIDPFPKAKPDDKAKDSEPPEVDFLQNAMLAAMTLPRTEVIRQDINAITAMNRRLQRLGALQERWKVDREQADKRGHRIQEPDKPDNLMLLDLADMMSPDGSGYGNGYALYHHLRVYDTTDSLTGIVARMAGYRHDSDQAIYLRQILRAWREDHFQPYHQPGRQPESVFLSNFDIGFRLRRLNDLRAAIDARLEPDPKAPQPPESVIALRDLRRLVEHELAAMRRWAWPLKADAARLLSPAEIETLTKAISANYGAAMQLPTLAARYEKAKEVYKQKGIKPLVDKALDRLGAGMRAAFDKSSADIRAALAQPGLSDLAKTYDGFHWHDVTTYPFLEGSEAQEHSEVQIFRISPVDSSLNPSPEKLAGIKVGAFGGFLNRDWREHDILWGRLDGAERIVAALMPDRTKDERERWSDRLQDAILREEFGPELGSARRLALVKAKLKDATIGGDSIETLAAGALRIKEPADLDLPRFRALYTKVQPPWPGAEDIAGWSSRGMTILSRMIYDLPDKGLLGFVTPRMAGALRAGGVLLSRLMRFAMPGSYMRLLAERIIFLVLFMGIVLVLLSGPTVPALAKAGWAMIGVCAGIWFLLYVLGRWLRGRASLPQILRWLLLLVALSLMAVGGVTVAKYLFG